jgi:LmbE family N-acetylglucosaminyl deacetylase
MWPETSIFGMLGATGKNQGLPRETGALRLYPLIIRGNRGMNRSKNILVLGGHLDDSVLAIGGIIKKLTQSGHQVSVVCMGNGDEGFAHLHERATVKEKFHREALEAHALLGVSDFTCHQYSDFEVNECKDIYRLCIQAIRRVKPELIFAHFPLEYFQHRAMARMSEDTWFQAAWACSADLGEPHQARAMYRFEVLQSMPEPTHIVDVSDCFETKLQAWAAFKTGQEHLSEEFDKMEARARFHGSKIGVRYAEALTQSFFMPLAVTDPARQL